MRNPNGFGGISYMGKNRRNPYRVRITTGWEYNEETGRQKQLYTTLGYYPSRKAAMIALAKYNENPFDLDRFKITFEDIWFKWAAAEFPKIKNQSTIATYKSAFKNLEPLHKRKVVDLKKNELQEAMDRLSDYSESAQTKAKVVMKAVFTYCMQNDLIDKDYSQFVKISPPKKGPDKHTPYTTEEIEILWKNLKTPVMLKYSAKDIRPVYPADLVLIAIYTGMRPGEILDLKKENINLEERYMIGGFKTESGTNRIIPIHEDIYPLVKARVESFGEWFVPYKSDHKPTLQQFRMYLFDPLMESLNMVHLPHDGRHTFATFADRSGLKDHYIKLIMGHKISDLTKKVYTDVTPAELVEAVNQISFLKK